MKKVMVLFILFVGFSNAAYANSFSNDWQKRNIIDDRQHRYDYTGTISTYPIYTGSAAKGAADSADAWRICKATDSTDGPTLIQCADGTWTGRAALTYN